MNRRIYKWDNIKAIMMLCVVIGHSVYRFIDMDAAKGIYTFIYTFHIPMFIFVSGLFSKKAIIAKKYERVFDFVAIYFVMKVLDTVSKALVSKNLSLHFFWEDGIGWYALAIAVFIFITMWLQDINQIKILLFFLMIGIIAGLDDHLGNHFVSMRICVFYPVFLAGFYFDPARINTWIKSNFTRKISLAAIGGIILAVLFVLCVTHPDKAYGFIGLLKGKQPYHKNIELVYRIIWYLFEVVIVGVFISIVPDVKCYLTSVGQRTMSIFVYHGCILNILYGCFGFRKVFQHMFQGFCVIPAILLALIVALLCSMIPTSIRLKPMSNKHH